MSRQITHSQSSNIRAHLLYKTMYMYVVKHKCCERKAALCVINLFEYINTIYIIIVILNFHYSLTTVPTTFYIRYYSKVKLYYNACKAIGHCCVTSLSIHQGIEHGNCAIVTKQLITFGSINYL